MYFPVNPILHVSEYENLPSPPRQEWMYHRHFLRIYTFGRNNRISQACHRHLLIYLVTSKLYLKLCVKVFTVVCLKHSFVYCWLVQSTNPGDVSQRDVNYLYCIEKTYGTTLCLMKSQISTWRKIHSHRDQTSRFNWDARFFILPYLWFQRHIAQVFLSLFMLLF